MTFCESSKYGLVACILGILVFSAPSTFAANKQETAESLFGLINQRLSYMEDVALYKAQRNIAIEDKQQEAVVINKAVQAAIHSGIDAISAERFMIAQINAAKSIQYQVLTNSSRPDRDAAESRDPDQDIRSALTSLGRAILRQASDYLIRFGSIDENDYRLFSQLIDNRYLEQNQEKILFDALSGLRLSKTLPPGFVDVSDVASGIRYELRYFSNHNFVGTVIDGYYAARLLLTEPAAQALAKVQAELETFGLGLLVYDAYRPQRAVDHFVRWAEDLDDTKNKQEFYPDVAKSKLFKQDYIARRSSHTRGSTVDLTIVTPTESGQPQTIDMGSPFDFFGPISWPHDTSITPQQRANRMLLRTLMVKHGFKPYPREWWHFTLANEPYPDTYFDFPIIAKYPEPAYPEPANLHAATPAVASNSIDNECPIMGYGDHDTAPLQDQEYALFSRARVYPVLPSPLDQLDSVQASP